ncbi:MAG: helix-turn-helix domain-containing protein [Thermomonas hydrothermalis]|uniref:helix-turn-helix domain-containing protein n=1 Tax=Thermomonas hydrothermalis TaxID=213588 RepID=UPI002356CA79|nr:helix-turn-helix domain-containing protein [Thermomonas hydrothermalis]MCL6619951.1 helix-turn-helix domain-containing protein [Thermomonas hydrothermalis]
MDTKVIDKDAMGARLRAERERLCLTQQQMCEAGGVSVISQRHYEAGRRVPDSEYLYRVAALNVDVLFVLCGTRSVGPRLDADEAELLRLWRAAPTALREAAMRVLGAPAGAAVPSAQISGGEQGQVVVGAQTITAPVHIAVGAKKGRRT